jgi:hypothetical protein
MRADLCRAHVELAQPDGRIERIKSHGAIVQEAQRKAKPAEERSTTLEQSGVLYPHRAPWASSFLQTHRFPTSGDVHKPMPRDQRLVMKGRDLS